MKQQPADAAATTVVNLNSNDNPQPRITRQTILCIGFLLYGLATFYPPLLLLVTVVLSASIPYAFRANDDGASRRRMWNEFLEGEDLPRDLRCEDVELEESYWANDRGMALLTSAMVPKNNAPILAVMCVCHGFMENASFMKRMQYQRFVKQGIAVVMIEYEGHGRSDGPNALIPCWKTLVHDVHSYFSHITTKEEKFRGKQKFLIGESMGGAVAYDIVLHHPQDYDGVVFVAPMCKILATPPNWVIDLLYKIVGEPGTVTPLSIMPWAPSKIDQPTLSFKDHDKMNLVLSSPTKYGRKPRLATARELLDATKRIGASIDRFDAPFLVIHGLEDHVTCPKVSEMLYRESPSKDKDIKLYKGMYHNLTGGETDENIDIVFNDVISW
eukprot:CAMPEP_0181102374 /NCGR_PEP_ID=MMETSP1071-20121207/14282_1 /TAXON_ID=35127 /ORGANISM="Thalassiosira sp., Strain NH16" /LENGTH=384 /DNA_ID=CAMNT_0023185345 /DNA_START=184 /DNA_END=1335 /DNA_ORIENTATION=-